MKIHHGVGPAVEAQKPHLPQSRRKLVPRASGKLQRERPFPAVREDAIRVPEDDLE